MIFSARARWVFRRAMALGLAFIYVPLTVVVINSFNASTVFAWPPKELRCTGGVTRGRTPVCATRS